MRTIWKGTLNLGRVAIPVGLAPTHTKGEISFRTLHRECGTPIEQRRWCPFHERALEPDELVKGYEVAPGQFVQVEDDELAAAAPEADRAIEILAFVRVEELYKIFAPSSTYYLAPAEQPVGRRPYLLLEEAMRETETAALCTFVAWGAQHLALVLPLGYDAEASHALVLAPVRWPEDLVATTEISEALAEVELTQGERDLATELVYKLLGKVDQLELANEHRQRIRALIDDKLAGKEIVVPEKRADEQLPLPPVDLEAALRKTLRQARRPRRRPKATKRRAKPTKA